MRIIYNTVIRVMHLRMTLHSKAIAFKKQTFYRFLNSCHINWRKFTALLCLLIIRDTISPLTNKDRINAFIVDDSLYSRGRSKKVELLANVYGNVEEKLISQLLDAFITSMSKIFKVSLQIYS